MINVSPPTNYVSLSQALPTLPTDLPFDLLLEAVPTPRPDGAAALASPPLAEPPVAAPPVAEQIESGATLLAFLGLNPAKAPPSDAAALGLPPAGKDDDEDLTTSDLAAPTPTISLPQTPPFAVALTTSNAAVVPSSLTVTAGTTARNGRNDSTASLRSTAAAPPSLAQIGGATITPVAQSADLADPTLALFADATGANVSPRPSDVPLAAESNREPVAASAPPAPALGDTKKAESAPLAVAAALVSPVPARAPADPNVSAEAPEDRAADSEWLGTSPIATTSASPAPALANGPTTAVAITQADPVQTIADRQLDLARDTRWIDELARDIVSASSRSDRLSFSLIPPQLGQLHVDLSQGDHGLSVHMRSESEATTQIVGAAQPRLVEELKSQGIRVASAEVSTGGGQSQGQGQGQQQRDESQLFEFARQRFETSDDKETDRPGGRFA